MAYSLEITPSRGYVQVNTSAFGDPTYNYNPTSIQGINSQYFIPRGYGFKTVYRLAGVDTSNTPDRIEFNNDANLLTATSATMYTYLSTQFPSNTSYDPNLYDYFLIVRKTNDYYSANVYTVTNFTKNYNENNTFLGTYSMTISLEYGNITTMGDVQNVIVEWQSRTKTDSSIIHGTSTIPLVYNGDKDAINTILQSGRYYVWYDTLNNFVPNVGSWGFGRYNLPNLNTSDVTITFTVIKNGITYSSYDAILKYEAPNSNPSGL